MNWKHILNIIRLGNHHLVNYDYDLKNIKYSIEIFTNK